MSYYRRFRIVLENPLFQMYLRKEYVRGINDLKKLNFKPELGKKGFTCLLCGVGNEATADQFIEFVLQRNPEAKIVIIDLGEEQVSAVSKLVKDKYSDSKILIKRINALDLPTILKGESVDWIETDGFLEFFDSQSISKMLKVWYQILSDDGFITTRMPLFNNGFEKMIYKWAVVIAKKWLGVDLYAYKKEYFNSLIVKNNFIYTDHLTMIPTMQSYSLIKK